MFVSDKASALRADGSLRNSKNTKTKNRHFDRLRDASFIATYACIAYRCLPHDE